MRIVFDKSQLEAAARFICAYNKAASGWEDCHGDPVKLVEKIRQDLIGGAQDPGLHYSMTGGWIILYDRDREDAVHVDVFVDPAINISPADLDYEEVEIKE